MDSSSKTFYHSNEFPARAFLDAYCSDNPEYRDEILQFPMEKLQQVFDKGQVKGDLLIDLSFAPLMHLLQSASDYFERIVMLKATESCISEARKWLSDGTGAFSWQHTSAFLAEKQGKSFGEFCEHNERLLKEKVSDVLKFDPEKEKVIDRVKIPPADSLITGWYLDNISKNKKEFNRYLNKILRLLKPGGNFYMFGSRNATFYDLNGEKFHLLNYNEEFLRSAMDEAKLTVDHFEVFPRKVKNNMCDFDAVFFVAAHTAK
ncbi:nicotinamide N-methyltransferase-like [Gastrophryne carolinensis]